MPITGDGGFPFRSAWFGRGRGRGRGAQPRQIVNVAVNPAYAAVWQDFIFAASGPAVQTLVPARYDNTNTFYAPTVAPGANTLTPVRYDNSNTFYSATVSQPNGNQNIIAPRVNNSNTFFSAVLTGGSQPQPIITTGSIVKPRRKFKPSILLDVEKKPEPAINAVIALEMVQAKSKVLAPSVSGTIIINAEIRLGAIQSMSRIMPAFAASSWNDPTDDEMIAIFALLE